MISTIAPHRSCSCFPECSCHFSRSSVTLMFASAPPETSHRPSGLKRTAVTALLWPLKVCTQSRWRASHTRTVLSSEPEAKKLLCGWKCRALGVERWPEHVRMTERGHEGYHGRSQNKG